MRECDLVMKGGITSGVVYPEAVLKLSKQYRLRSIGGSSAGAIAAVIAAAAEYRRQTGGGEAGFEAIGALGKELASDMRTLFQPAPEMTPLFDAFVSTLGEGSKFQKAIRAVKSFAVSFPFAIPVPIGLGLGVAIVGLWRCDITLVLAGLAGGILLGLLGVVWSLCRLLQRLRSYDFGICPGTRQTPNTKPALTEWLADKIDAIAGNLANGSPGRPLTIGQLAEQKIVVSAMTTDLSSGRPYQLPLKSHHHHFRKSEFEKIFPKRVVEYLVGGQEPVPAGEAGDITDLYKLPSGDNFPVLLVARLSLSFPGLISAVPLYRKDYQIKEAGKTKFRRCLFSDGGISSNFPIHFFDAFLPGRPTFGIMLTDYLEDRHPSRVEIADRGRQSTDLPVREIGGVLRFLGSILGTAKDWQDTLQSLLPGYADRIVEIRLDKTEGGLNLAMSEETITKLLGYGAQAGKAFDEFDFDEHRWLRAISLAPELEDGLAAMRETYAEPSTADQKAYKEILTEHKQDHYAELSSGWRRDVLKPFVERLAAAAEHASARGKGVRKGMGDHGPQADANVRLTASADRVPR